MSKKQEHFIQSSIQDLLHLLEKNPEAEYMIGQFRLTAVLGFLIEMCEVYPVDAAHKKHLLEVRNELTNIPVPMAFTDFN
jgi:hypothetical protein